MAQFIRSLLLLSSIVGLCYSQTVPNPALHWVRRSSAGFSPRLNPAAVVVNGKIYVIGGSDGQFLDSHPLNTVEVYDPVTDTWSTPITIGNLPARTACGAVAIDEDIYVFGGEDSAGKLLNDVWVLHTQTNVWNKIETTGLFTPRRYLSAVVVDDKIFTFGGAKYSGLNGNIEVLDPRTKEWTYYGGAHSAFHPSVNAVRDTIYIFGGGTFGTELNSLDILAPQGQFGQFVSAFMQGEPSPRANHTSAVLDEVIYNIGGNSGPFKLDTIDILDPGSKTWFKFKPQGPFTPRQYLTSAVVDGTIYTFGGASRSGTTTNLNEALTDAPLSVPKQDRMDFSIAPNPASETVHIHSESRRIGKIELLSELGSVVRDIKPTDDFNCRIELTGLSAGIYFAKIFTATGFTVSKVLKR